MAKQILFDGELPPEIDIPRLWQTGEPSGDEAPTSNMRRSGRLLLREHPRSHFPSLASQEELRDMINTASDHFRRLQDFGMSVISFKTVINNDPWPEDYFDWEDEDALAFSASAYVAKLHSLRSPLTDKPLRSVRRSKVEEFVLEPLKRYVDWGVSTGQPRLLDDIATPDQYGWQRTSGIVALHDPGPQMEATETVADGLQETLEHFAWVGRP